MSGPKTGGRYRVAAAAKLAGVSPHTLRVWERRHGPFASLRSPGGNRLYSDEDVEHVRRLKKLADAGQAIGTTASLDARELARIERQHREADGRPDPALGPLSLQRLLEAARAFELDAVEEILSRAAVALSPRDLVEDVVGPFLRGIGQAWQDGEVGVSHEHAVTALLRTTLGAQLRGTRARRPGLPAVVVATPEGEPHEIGALGAALVAAASGFRAIYLGPSLPAAEIAAAAERSGACAILLSCIALPEAAKAVAAVRKLLPAGVALIVGGPAAPSVKAAKVVQDLVELEPLLRTAAASFTSPKASSR